MNEVMSIIRESLNRDSIEQMGNTVANMAKIVFKCEAASLMLNVNPERKTLDVGNIYSNVDESIIEKYVEYYHKTDPYIEICQFLPSVVRVGDYVPRNVFESTPYYKELFKMANLKHQMALILRSGHYQLGVLVLLRGPNSKNFNAHHVRDAEMLIPFLSEVTKKYMMIQELNRKADMLDSILNSLPYKSILVFNKHSELVYMDEEAHKHLNYLNKEYYQHNFDINPVYILEKSIAHLQKQFGSTSWVDLKDLYQDFKIILDSKKEPIRILLRSVQCRNRSKYLVLSFESLALQSSVTRKMSEFNLSHREKEVAGLVLKGLNNDQISDALFISRYTVENHLRSIYDKFSVSSRSMLISKMVGAISL